jgi:sterol desaturase/sphingolipid hydroxylase (fatty acid hydroxylase superfamily)
MIDWLRAFDHFLVYAGAYLTCAFLLSLALCPRHAEASRPTPGQRAREAAWSLGSSAIFVGLGMLALWLQARGMTKIYFDIDERSIEYFAASVVLMLVIHDTYFYWSHRLMHWRPIFRYAHRLHHGFHRPSPWGAFAFHPLETLIEAQVMFVIVFAIPTHPAAFMTFAFIMTFWSSMIHAERDLLPSWVRNSPLGRCVISASDHAFHHRKGGGNYGLYTSLWDALLGTLRREACQRARRVHVR